jgi:hypothetical protein
LIGFGFSPILKDAVGADNGDGDTHRSELVPKPAPLILILDFTAFKLERLKQSLKLHGYVYFLFLICVLNKLFSQFLFFI